MATPRNDRIAVPAGGPDGFAFEWDQEILDATLFQQREKASAVADAARHLREAIILCLLPSGAKLPTEPELAQRLGVGVVTMHSALSLLREEGFIITRRGRHGGSWVASADEIVRASMRSASFDVSELREQSEVVIALESQAMGLAAVRATDAERAAILEIASYPRDEMSIEERQRHSNIFHLQIAIVARNDELLEAIRRRRARLQELRTVAVGHFVFCTHGSHYQPLIAQAIADGDPEEARNVCHRFLTDCWTCNITVIEYGGGVEGRDVALIGPLDARLHLAR